MCTGCLTVKHRGKIAPWDWRSCTLTGGLLWGACSGSCGILQMQINRLFYSQHSWFDSVLGSLGFPDPFKTRYTASNFSFQKKRKYVANGDLRWKAIKPIIFDFFLHIFSFKNQKLCLDGSLPIWKAEWWNKNWFNS